MLAVFAAVLCLPSCVFKNISSAAQIMLKYLWHLPYGCRPSAPYVVRSSTDRVDEKDGHKGQLWRVLYSAVHYVSKQRRSAADLPGKCNGWAWSVKPPLLSLIHVSQDNLHRSSGATMGDTEKEADPVGARGTTEKKEAMEEGVGDWSAGVVRQKLFRQWHKKTFWNCGSVILLKPIWLDDIMWLTNCRNFHSL